MKNDELCRIEAIAKAATPGPWEWEWEEWKNGGRITDTLSASSDILSASSDILSIGFDLFHRDLVEFINIKDPDANYIAAANPSTILRMIKEIRRLQSRVLDKD